MVRVWEHAIFEALDEVVASLNSVPVVDEVNSLRVVQVDAADDGTGIERRRMVHLADPSYVVETVSGPRVTAKWRRPRTVSRSLPASAPGSG